MAKEKEKKTKSQNGKSFFADERVKFVIGIFITCFALFFFIACISYLFSWKFDDSLPNSEIVSGADVKVKNWSGKSGLFLARYLIAFGFGYGAFFIPLILGVAGLSMLNFPRLKPLSLITKFAFAAILVSLIFSFIFGEANGYLKSGPGGAQGYLIVQWLKSFAGTPGTGGIIILLTIIYLVFALKVKPQSFAILLIPFKLFRKKPPVTKYNLKDNFVLITEEEDENHIKFTVTKPNYEETDETDNEQEQENEKVFAKGGPIVHDLDNQSPVVESIHMNVSKYEADVLSDEEVDKNLENYDPRLDLSRYKFPPVSILRDYKSESAFDDSEVHENKENIIKTLGDYGIGIKSIAATIGPTVTLYEIVQERGIKIARIKSLEDDIAQNLSALGIRIIAPIPGRGTVGIEVPNKKPEMVTMKSLITSKAFQETKFDIPLALGRTITNEPYIVDLTKMPHLLVAGSTGQGKSVGLNAIITSILFKKHPSELKFVLIDPKMVELPLYSKIERHFLAKLRWLLNLSKYEKRKITQSAKND
jgi:S-DNA-T family DNA segregation ATPase FtsK/SpoIIIE